jgi:hypothetical protein
MKQEAKNIKEFNNGDIITQLEGQFTGKKLMLINVCNEVIYLIDCEDKDIYSPSLNNNSENWALWVDPLELKLELGEKKQYEKGDIAFWGGCEKEIIRIEGKYKYIKSHEYYHRIGSDNNSYHIGKLRPATAEEIKLLGDKINLEL